MLRQSFHDHSKRASVIGLPGVAEIFSAFYMNYVSNLNLTKDDLLFIMVKFRHPKFFSFKIKRLFACSFHYEDLPSHSI